MEIELELLPSGLANKVGSYAGGEVSGRKVEHRFSDVCEDGRVRDVGVVCSEVCRHVFESNLDAILLPDLHEGHRFVEGAVLKMQAFEDQLGENEVINARDCEILDSKRRQWKIVNLLAQRRQNMLCDRVEELLIKEKCHRLVLLCHAARLF